MRIAVPRETAPGERRVALVPDAAGRLVKAGLAVAVEAGAGLGAHFEDNEYAAAGAAVAPTAAALYESADLVLKVRCPSAEEATGLRAGSLLIAFLQPGRDAAALEVLAGRRVTALSMDLVPRITRAQAMDALSSQSTVAGYKAVLVGAAALAKLMPMLVTAAGTLAPSTAFVLGAGVAGLQAIATARRLGASVRAFDVRPAVKEQVESLGATFVAAEALAADAEAKGGYAREATEEERARQAAAIAKHVAEADLVIATAQVPGKRAPVLITEEMVRVMRPGSVIVDLAAETGGNCALTEADREVICDGTTIIGPTNLAASLPTHASQMYSRNLVSLVQHLVKDGRLVVDPADEITGAMLVTPAAEGPRVAES
ncbi:MAG: Re/Si-specific NAD(P)(+) transhydrogenase subunit alpha [Gemmatimonadetes bacterium]|nr:Re/Si-specific NAD(P)(+) transhydrogenase subunit alpha [Gemmatimonadota bacterium]